MYKIYKTVANPSKKKTPLLARKAFTSSKLTYSLKNMAPLDLEQYTLHQ